MPIVQVSYGELFDKITILEIKLDRLKSTTQINFIESEYKLLNAEVNLLRLSKEARKVFEELLKTNLDIWEDMETILRFEPDNESPLFLKAVQRTLKNNVKRSYLKRQIDDLLDSPLREAKSYFDNESERLIKE
jgi:hypothetical protein